MNPSAHPPTSSPRAPPFPEPEPAPAHAPAPDSTALRDLCFKLVDLPACDRNAILGLVNLIRRADDSWRLHALFEGISQTRGDSVARDRLAMLVERFR